MTAVKAEVARSRAAVLIEGDFTIQLSTGVLES